MSITGQQLLNWATNTCPITDECGIRACISRSYYAAYYEAKNYHDALPVPGRLPSKLAGIHNQLAHQLAYPAPEVKDEAVKSQSQNKGKLLAILHQLRIEADYHTEKNIDLDTATQAQSIAKRIIG